jgi:hypothetical protein
MHAAAALSFMIAFCESTAKLNIPVPQKDFLNQEALAMREALTSTIHDLLRVCAFTQLGNALMTDFIGIARSEN